MIKRVVFVGELSPNARSLQRMRAMRGMGYEVFGVSTAPRDFVPGISRKPSLWDRLRYRLGYPTDAVNLNEEVIEAVHAHSPELLWVEKALVLKRSTLLQCKKLRPTMRIGFCSEDDMFARHNQSAYFRAAISVFDIVFTTKSYNCGRGELLSLGARQVVFVDNAYDPDLHRPIVVTDEERARIGGDVGFVGTFERSRAEQMLVLVKAGIQVRVWGNGWGNWAGKHSLLRIENRPLYGDEYVKAVCATRINLCFLRKLNRDLQTSRSVEIPACGGFMLAERTGEHRRLFEENKEAVYFDIGNPRELVEKAAYYLGHDDQRQTIAHAGRRRCLEGHYSHYDRLSFMLSHVR